MPARNCYQTQWLYTEEEAVGQVDADTVIRRPGQPSRLYRGDGVGEMCPSASIRTSFAGHLLSGQLSKSGWPTFFFQVGSKGGSPNRIN